MSIPNRTRHARSEANQLLRSTTAASRRGRRRSLAENFSCIFDFAHIRLFLKFGKEIFCSASAKRGGGYIQYRK